MGRKTRSKKQNCEASVPDQIHNEEAQQGDPIDPDQEQVILPDPEEQDDPEPEPQQEEIHQDPPVDPIPNPSQEEQEIHQDSEEDEEQNQEQEEIHQNLQKHQGQEEVCKEPEEDQRVHQALNVVVEEQQEILISESDTKDHHDEVLPLSQKSFEQETQTPMGIPPDSQEIPEQEVKTPAVTTTLEESQETKVGTRVGVTSVSHETAESGSQTPAMVQPILEESLSQEVEIQARTNQVSKGAPEQEEIDLHQKQSHLIEENIVRTDENHTDILPTISNFLPPSFHETRREISEQDHQNIILAFVACTSLLVLRVLRRLLGLEGITDFPALEGPQSIAQHSTESLPASRHIPLLSFQESSTIVPLTEVLDYETEMRSELRIIEDLEQADRTETSQRHAEASEALAVGLRKPMKARPRKQKNRREPSKPGHADAIEYQELLDYKNPPIEDPGEPDFDDPRELLKLIESENAELSSPDELDFSDLREQLKDLNFLKMKADNQETKQVGNLKLETIVNLESEDEDLKTEFSEYSITEASKILEKKVAEDLKAESEGESKTEVDENLETEAETYLETEEEDLELEKYEDLEMDNHGHVEVEVCEPPLPPAGRPPPADGNPEPNDLEEVSPNECPNNEENSAGSRNVCTRRISEDAEESSYTEEDEITHLGLIMFCLILCVIASPIIIIVLVDQFKENRNTTSLANETTTALNEFKINFTDMYF